MRNAVIERAFDRVAYDAAIRSGLGPAILEQLGEIGVTFRRTGPVTLMPSNFMRGAGASYNAMDSTVVDIIRYAQRMGLALASDAVQPESVLQANAGTPAFLTNFIDPRVIEALVTPMNIALILGETRKGDWLTTVATFPDVEMTGEPTAYGDYNMGGSVSVNTNFPQRQTFHYQTFTQWGERELGMAGLAGIDWAAKNNAASILILNKFQNRSYAFGIAGLDCFGLLNDPALYTPIAPTAQWNLTSTDAGVIYEDIRRLFVALQNQCGGTINNQMAMTLALSPTIRPALLKTSIAGQVVNVEDLLKKNFPNMRIQDANEYETEAGQLVQLIIDAIDGVETATCGYTEKLRAHAIETKTSSWLQKKSQGTIGTIIFRPFAIGQMLGV